MKVAVGEGVADRSFSVAVGVLVCVALVLCEGCAGGGGQSNTPPPAQTVDVAVSGQTVTKVRASGGSTVVLQERLTSIFEDGPQRTVMIVQSDGRTSQPYTAPLGWSVVDFAVHPSGEMSVVLTTARDVRVVRLDASGALRSDQTFVDASAASDPYFDYEGGLKDDTALQPALMHDAARLAPIGESLAVVLRTGRNAVVAYRLDPDTSGAYQRAWRTLVEPGASILGLGITSGSFDVFGQLQNHVRIYADADSNGTLAVGVVNSDMRNFTFRAHSDYFNEPITATAGVLLTRVATSDGRRLGSTVIDTQQRSELHGLRATPNGFAMVGRVLSEVRADGTGWNAWAAFVGRDGTPGPYRVIDVNQGDVLFDIVALPSGRYIATGTTGYVQNPSGASISEAAQPMLLLLNADGTVAQNAGYTGGARHNQLTSITNLNGRWLVGGMVNGPGTHSGDGDRSLIKADGFVREAGNLPAQ